MKMHKVTMNTYESDCGRIKVTKVMGRLLGVPQETFWLVRIDGKELKDAFPSKQEAISAAEKKLSKILVKK